MPSQGFAPFPWRPPQRRQLELAIGGDYPWLEVALRGAQAPRVQIPERGRGMGKRLDALLGFCDGAAQLLANRRGVLRVQLLDEDPSLPCIRFDAPAAADGGGPLIPDPYCLMSGGYGALREELERRHLPPWRQRLPIALWRGSSTGLEPLDLQNLHHNQRYQLCLQGQAHPQLLDARFTAVVQSRDPQTQQALTALLHRQDLLRPRVEPWDAALHRWLIEIDGNVNSWGLLWKLLSGSCVLRVASPRRQWYHHRLQPWVHVVPVAADLTDLNAKLHWCRAHPDQCQAIALAGQQLAQQVVADLGDTLAAACLAYGERWLAPG
ncbi:glycosyl transferase family 90 [Vulcanococcus sp.]|jgi:hypothetical protein|uniref:glycosyl transferase family 90 n=1 Tax=Vulcanococcus sp. TaxID=2856995 RepID=UPI0037D9A444